MKFSNGVLITLLIGIVPLVCGKSKTVRMLNSCNRKIEIDDDETAYLSIDGSDWRYSYSLTCHVDFKADDSDNNLAFDVTSFKKLENIEIRIDASRNGYNFNIPVATSLWSGRSMKTFYRYLRITVRRRMSSQMNYNIKLRIQTSKYGSVSNQSPPTARRRATIWLSIGAIIGIVLAILSLIAIAVIVAVCCCCRRRQGGRGTVMAPTTQATTESQINTGYPASYPYQPGPNPYYGQGAQYTGQPGYPVQGYTPQPPPTYPGYPTNDHLPPPYPGYGEYKNEENRPM